MGGPKRNHWRICDGPDLARVSYTPGPRRCRDRNCPAANPLPTRSLCQGKPAARPGAQRSHAGASLNKSRDCHWTAAVGPHCEYWGRLRQRRRIDVKQAMLGPASGSLEQAVLGPAWCGHGTLASAPGTPTRTSVVAPPDDAGSHPPIDPRLPPTTPRTGATRPPTTETMPPPPPPPTSTRDSCQRPRGLERQERGPLPPMPR